MNDIRDLENQIIPILEKYPVTRDNDKLLYLKLLHSNGYDINIRLRDYLSDYPSKYPSYDSVSRCRRKIQSVRQDLVGTRKAVKNRAQRENDYREYSKG